MTRYRLFFVLVTLCCAFVANAAENTTSKSKAAICMGCHGPDGRGIPGAESLQPVPPKIAGLAKRYLSKSMYEYRDKMRPEPLMSSVAAGLSDEDIEKLASYFSSIAW